MKQRVAARLLLASCTLALGLGLGTALAVTGVLALQHPTLTVSSPGQAEGDLDRGLHEVSVRGEGDLGLERPGGAAAPGNRPGGSGNAGEPPGGTGAANERATGSRPACTVVDTRTGRQAPPTSSGRGVAAVEVERAGAHRVECSSAAPVTVVVSRSGESLGAYLTAVGRGLLLAVVLTVLAAVLAARALVAARRLRTDPPAG